MFSFEFKIHGIAPHNLIIKIYSTFSLENLRNSGIIEGILSWYNKLLVIIDICYHYCDKRAQSQNLFIIIDCVCVCVRVWVQTYQRACEEA